MAEIERQRKKWALKSQVCRHKSEAIRALIFTKAHCCLLISFDVSFLGDEEGEGREAIEEEDYDDGEVQFPPELRRLVSGGVMGRPPSGLGAHLIRLQQQFQAQSKKSLIRALPSAFISRFLFLVFLLVSLSLYLFIYHIKFERLDLISRSCSSRTFHFSRQMLVEAGLR